MKRLLLALLSAVAVVSISYAIQPTRTPPVPPTETGEDSLHSGEIFNMARVKPGFTQNTTAAGTAAAATLTANTAAGSVTWPAPLTVVSNAVATLTVTDSKVQAGDAVLCMVDSTGAAAGSVPEASSVQVSNGSFVCVLTNASATSPAVAVKVYWLVLTQGNPN